MRKLLSCGYVLAVLTVMTTIGPRAAEAVGQGHVKPVLVDKDTYHMTTLVRSVPQDGAESIHSTNGLSFAWNDDLLIGSYGSRQLITMHPQSGRVLDRISIEGHGFGYIDDSALMPDGKTIYATVLFGYFNPDGSASGAVVKIDMETRTVTDVWLSGNSHTNPITYDAKGNSLYVGTTFMGAHHGLWRLDLDANYEFVSAQEIRLEPAYYDDDPRVMDFVPDFSNTKYPDATALIVSPSHLEHKFNLNGFTFKDGYLYAPFLFYGHVVKIDVTTGHWEPLVDNVYASYVNYNPHDGYLYATSWLTGKLWRIDMKHYTKVEVATVDPEGGLDSVTFDSKGRIFVGNFAKSTIAEVLPSGEVRIVRKGTFCHVRGAAWDPTAETALAVDSFSVVTLDLQTGQRLSSAIRMPFMMPTSIFMPPSGKRIVVSSFRGIVEVTDGSNVDNYFVDKFPGSAAEFKGSIYVSAKFAKVVRLLSDGASEIVPELAGIPRPTGLAVYGDKMYIASAALGKIYEWDGTVVAEVASGLNAPEGMAADVDGSLLVIAMTGTPAEGTYGSYEYANLERVIPNGGIETVMENLMLISPRSVSVQVPAVNPDGTVLVPVSGHNELYVLYRKCLKGRSKSETGGGRKLSKPDSTQ